MASRQQQHGRRLGECSKAVRACNLLEGLFIDDMLTKEDVGAGRFYFDPRAPSVPGPPLTPSRATRNFSIITDGNNLFDRDVYRVPQTSGPQRFGWGIRLSTGTVPRKRHGAERKARSLLIAGPAGAPQPSNRLGSHGVGTPESIVGRV